MKLTDYEAMVRLMLKELLDGVEHQYALEMLWAKMFDETGQMIAKAMPAETAELEHLGPSFVKRMADGIKASLPMTIHMQLQAQQQSEDLYKLVIGEEAAVKLITYMQDSLNMMLFNSTKLDIDAIMIKLFGEDYDCKSEDCDDEDGW